MRGTEETMRHLGTVSTEGGPLLVLDASLLPHWRGAYGTGADYGRACAVFDTGFVPEPDGGLIAIGPDHGVLWEMAGAGTAWIFCCRGDRYVIARTWLHADDANGQSAAVQRLAGRPVSGTVDLGILDTPSQQGLVVWATEDTSLVTSLGGADGRPQGDWGVEDCALTVVTPAGRYRFLHDEIETADGMARRLFMSAA